MKKAFTLIELLLVIVITGILGTIGFEILQKIAKNYIVQKEMNKLALKTDITLNIIAAKLKTRIKNSAIGSHADDNGNPNGEFISTSNNTIGTVKHNKKYYNVLEWLSYSIYSKRGMWSDELKRIKPGWSGFVDLKKTENYGDDKYKIVTPDSNFTIVQLIDGNWSEVWGVDGYDNVLDNNLDVLVFTGASDRGDFNNIRNSYGWYGTKATRVFAINKLSDTELNLTAVDKSNTTTVYEGYYIVNTAMAIVPVKNGEDYNLTLRFNYYPWKDENYTEGNTTLLATHVTQFKFKEENELFRIYLCLTSENQKLKDYNLTFCKEKVIF